MAHSQYYDFINYCVNDSIYSTNVINVTDTYYTSLNTPDKLLQTTNYYPLSFNYNGCTTYLYSIEHNTYPDLGTTNFDTKTNTIEFIINKNNGRVIDNDIYMLIYGLYNEHEEDQPRWWYINEHYGTAISSIGEKILEKIDRNIQGGVGQDIAYYTSKIRVGFYINCQLPNYENIPFFITFWISNYFSYIEYPDYNRWMEYSINITSEKIIRYEDTNQIIISIPNIVMSAVSIDQYYDEVMPTYNEIYSPLAIQQDLTEIPGTEITSINQNDKNKFLIYDAYKNACKFNNTNNVQYADLKTQRTINYDNGQFVRYVDLNGQIKN